VLGRHQGLAFYTIGQRKGLGIAAPQPWYVFEKDIARNILVISSRQDLGKRSLIAKNANWIDGQFPEAAFRASVKIRYKAEDLTAVIDPLPEQRFRVNFDQALRDITPGQFAWYMMAKFAWEVVLSSRLSKKNQEKRTMTLPAFLFGFCAATLYGGLMHLWKAAVSVDCCSTFF